MNGDSLPEGGTLYCLVGGQPMPNLLAVLQVQPKRVVLLHTDSSLTEAQRTASTIAKAGLTPPPIIELQQVDAYESWTTYRKVSSLNPDDVISFTSGTKPMLIGALSGLFTSGQGTGIYHNPIAHQFHRYQAEELPPLPVTVKITIAQALGLAGREIVSEQPLSTEKRSLGLAFQHKPLRNKVLRRIGGDRTLDGGIRSSLGSARISRPFIDQMLAEIADGNNEWKNFANGGWLEYATAAVLLGVTADPFDEVRLGVKVKPADAAAAGENEYDVLAIRRTDLYYFSCKDCPPKVDYLHEVVTRGRELGLFCRKFLVNPDHEHTSAFQARAREHGIGLIASLVQLRSLGAAAARATVR